MYLPYMILGIRQDFIHDCCKMQIDHRCSTQMLSAGCGNAYDSCLCLVIIFLFFCYPVVSPSLAQFIVRPLILARQQCEVLFSVHFNVLLLSSLVS